jgi:hypothetical protein
VIFNRREGHEGFLKHRERVLVPCFLAVLLGASSAHADTLADLKTTVSTLHATTPVHASVEIQRSRTSAGRFVNRTSAGRLTIDVIDDESGLKIALAPELMARAEREWHEHGADPNKATPTRDALDETQLTDIAEAMDFGARLLDMIAVGHRVVERRVPRNGRSVRLVRLELTPKLPTEATSIWHVKFTEDRLDIWVGDDNLPVAAERVRHGSAGFLFLRGQMNRADSWTFAHVGDRLVVTRSESSFDASGFGERGEGRNIQTLTIR